MKNEITPSKIQELALECKVEDAMTVEVITIAPDDTMAKVRYLLQDKSISGLPVVEHDKMVGIISIEDLINCLLNSSGSDKVKDKMTSDVKFLYNDESLISAVNKFEKLGFGRFPVLERISNKLVGIIAKGDIVKCLLKKLEIDYHKEELPKYKLENIFEDIVSDKTTLILRHTIRGGDYKVAGRQSGCLKNNLLRIGIPPNIARRIVIASCEAEMNIIIFTEGGELIASVEKDNIKVNAIDRGPGIPDIEKAMQPGFSTAPDWVREMGFGAGMGLPNIKNYTDEMRIDSKVGEGTNLEFIVKLQNEVIGNQN
jgi:predicted transcriptional regulator/anti-sigma regulatory factor (Ser/Thr protein kinase)